MYELTINLQQNEKTPLYEQIYSYIKNHIQSGRIPYGERLPSTRALSRHLEVSRSTVELAYEQLLSEGYVESRPYKGFFVAQIEELYRIQKVRSATSKQVVREKKWRHDFTASGVDLKSFPYNIWRRISREILLDNQSELFRLGDSRGEYGFRNAICDYLYQARGVNCVPEQIIVGAGSDYMLMLLGIILGKDHVIAFEDPTYMQAYRLFESLSYLTVPVEMDKEGMRVSALLQTGADIAYVTPSHQYPTGIVMPIKRRMELLKWAGKERERYIIEDDYDSEFRYRGKPIPALQGYDVQGKVVYLGTFSKAIAPAIRLSYMVLPHSLLSRYEQKSRFISSTVSKLDQMIVQRFIEQGHFERHLNKTRALYKCRHDCLIEGLKPLFPMCAISGENAGVHILLSFPNAKEEELIARAARKGVRVYGLSDYQIHKQTAHNATLILGYANMSEEQIKEALQLLKEAWVY